VPPIPSRHSPQSGLVAALLQFVSTDPQSSNSLFVICPAESPGVDCTVWGSLPLVRYFYVQS
jgi:hypothetical protein